MILLGRLFNVSNEVPCSSAEKDADKEKGPPGFHDETPQLTVPEAVNIVF